MCGGGWFLICRGDGESGVLFFSWVTNGGLKRWVNCLYLGILFLYSQPRKIQFLRTFGVGPFFFFSGLINANAIFQWSTGDGR